MPTAVKVYKTINRWCSTCVRTPSRSVLASGPATDKFWRGCIEITSACPGCKNQVTDFYKPAELAELEALGLCTFEDEEID